MSRCVAADTYTGKDGEAYVSAYIVERLDRPTLERMSIGERIKQARAKKGLTQNALASLIAVTNPKFAPINVSRWETETQALSSSNALLLAQALGVSLDWLMIGQPSSGA